MKKGRSRHTACIPKARRVDALVYGSVAIGGAQGAVTADGGEAGAEAWRGRDCGRKTRSLRGGEGYEEGEGD